MLTGKQRRLLCFIEDSMRENRIAPSYEEAREALGLKSKSSVHRMMQALIDRGYVARLANRARAIEVIRPSDEASPGGGGSPEDPRAPDRIPLLGHVAAGVPVVVWESPDREVGIPPGWAPPGSENFALEVRGDSMAGAGIFEGDTVVIRSQNTAGDGDIVVALVDREETTLKRFQQDAGRGEILLRAGSPGYPDLRYAADRVIVQGRLTGLLRRYT